MCGYPLDDSPPVWLFLSVSLGWIAYADIHTENWRYAPSLPICVRMQWLINRFAGDTRFTAGVLKKFVSMSRYDCSVAAYDHQTEKPTTGTEKEQRQAVKDGLKTFYQTAYAKDGVVVSEAALASANLDDLITTIVPPDRWEMKSYNLISLYAGKVHVSCLCSPY
jgi:hypothetical protein